MGEPIAATNSNGSGRVSHRKRSVQRMLLPVDVEPIPDGTGKLFRDWCAEREQSLGIHFLGGGRRAWSITMNAYIRNQDIVIYLDREAISFGYRDELRQTDLPRAAE